MGCLCSRFGEQRHAHALFTVRVDLGACGHPGIHEGRVSEFRHSLAQARSSKGAEGTRRSRGSHAARHRPEPFGDHVGHGVFRNRSHPSPTLTPQAAVAIARGFPAGNRLCFGNQTPSRAGAGPKRSGPPIRHARDLMSCRRDWGTKATTSGAMCAAAQPVSSHDDHSLTKVDNHQPSQ